MASASQSSGVTAVRSSKFFITPPGILGFNNLIVPEDPFKDGKLAFKLNCHFNAAQAERLMALMDRDVIEANQVAFEKAVKDEGKKPPGGSWQWPSARDWVDDHLKEAKEKDRQKLPHIQFSNEATYRDRNGATKQKIMRAYDAGNELLDLMSLRNGGGPFPDMLPLGSVVQIILQGGLYISPLVKQPQPSLKLQGLRVIKLEVYEGRKIDDVSEEDMELAGVDADDLSAYAGQTDVTKALAPRKEDSPRNDYADLDDEIPF